MSQEKYINILRSMRHKGTKPRFITLGNSALQAFHVADEIETRIYNGIKPNSIAVLYRAHFASMELQMELTRRKIPFVVRSGLRFFDQGHIKDCAAFLKIFSNPLDEVSWKRLLCMLDGIGKVTAEKIWQHISSTEDPLGAVISESCIKIIPPKSRNGSRWFREAVNKAIQSDKAATTLIYVFLTSGYEYIVQDKFKNAESRIEDITELINFSRNFNTLDDFLSEMVLMTTQEESDVNKKDRDDENKVILSSIHQSKGLEWAVVMVIWCTDGMLPLARALEEDGNDAEERRLFYVAGSRAKDELILFMPRYNSRTGTYCEESRFIAEIENSGLYERTDVWD